MLKQKQKQETITFFKQPRFKTADQVEDVLCLAVLMAKGSLSHDCTCEDANTWMSRFEYGCSDCPHSNECLAVIMNE